MSQSRIDKSQNKKPYSGFVNRTDSNISIDGSGVFTIQPAVDNYEIYTESRGKIVLDSAQTVNITDDQTITFIYFNENGVLQSSTSVWDITDGDMIPVSVVFKDSTIYTITDERHGYQRDLEWHRWAHSNIGTMYRSGLTGAFTDTTFSVAQGVIYDEDIDFDTGGSETTTSLWYRNATSGMRIERGSTTPKYVSGGILQYDNGSGAPTDVTVNRYVTNFVYATNDPAEPIYTVIGQNNSVNLTDAQNVSNPTINLSTAEWKLIYRLIFRRTAGTPDGELVEVEDFREVQTGTTSTSVSPSSHTALIDRDASNSHPLSAITGVETEVAYGGVSGAMSSESVFTYNDTTDTLTVPNIEFSGLIDGVTSDGIQVGSDLDEFKIGLSLYRSGSFIGGLDNSGGDFRLKAQNANDIQLINDGNVGLQVTDGNIIDVVGSPTISNAFQGLISHTNIIAGDGSDHTYIDQDVTITSDPTFNSLALTESVKVGDDTDTCDLSKVGALRYRVSGSNSYCDMCMQTGAATYAWNNIVQNNW